jgi:hypothetical protein
LFEPLYFTSHPHRKESWQYGFINRNYLLYGDVGFPLLFVQNRDLYRVFLNVAQCI